MAECTGCEHFYYNNDGSGACDTPYEKTCLHALHAFHSNSIRFAEEYLDIKLYWYQKLMLQWSMKRGKNVVIKAR